MGQRKIIEPEVFPFLDYKRYSFSLAVQKGDYLFFSGYTASQYDPGLKKTACRGSISEQASVAYEKIKLLIEAAGGTLDDVVKITEYIAPPGIVEYKSVDKVKLKYLGSTPPAMTAIIVNNLVRPDALIEVEAVAVLDNSKRQTLSPGWPKYPVPTCSPGVKKGDLLFISGQCGIDHNTSKIISEGDIIAQTSQAYRNIKAILESAGATFDDVVKIIDYIAPDGLAKYGDAKEVRAQYFRNSYPAATEVVVQRLLPEAALIEVDCIAVLGDGRKETYDLGKNLHKGLTYSPIVKKGNLVFLSGATSINMETNQLVGKDDVVAQLSQIFLNAEKMLGDAGLSWKDVVKTVEFVAIEGGANYRNTADVRRQYFKETLPASTGVYTSQLLQEGALIQVDFVAVAD